MKSSPKAGFTLSELLIALAILGVIATFTIPKVLQSQEDGKYKAIAKEAAGTIAQAYDAYKLKNTPTASTLGSALNPYLNYVRKYTGMIDDVQTATNVDCSPSYEHCFVLHNGAVIRAVDTYFNGTASTNALRFYIDPDGKETDGSTNGPGKSVWFWLYFNGRMTTVGNTLPGTTDSIMTGYAPAPAKDPPWFSWD